MFYYSHRMTMIFRRLWPCVVLFSMTTASDRLQTGLIQEFYDVFNNLSNVALMPHLMESANCRRDCEIYRRALHQNHLWAAEIFDANGKQSFPVLQGYMHRFGNVKQCVSASSELSNIEGKFCLARIYLRAVGDDNLINMIPKKPETAPFFTTNPYENAAFPFGAIVSASCIPSSCTARDLITASRKVLSVLNETRFGLEAHVDDIDEGSCAIRKEYLADDIPIIYYAKIFVIAMSILVICATLIDAFFLQTVKNSRRKSVVFFKSLSLQQNLRILTSVEKDNDSLGVLNGLRCLTLYNIFVEHHRAKFGFGAINISDTFELMNNNPIVSSISRNTHTHLDLLHILSGISHSYKITRFVIGEDLRSVFKSMVYKYLRFLAFMSILYLFRTMKFNKNEFTLVYKSAQDNFDIWSVLLCYENFYGLENMFFVVSHTIYTDLQFYFICCVLQIFTRHFNHKTKFFFSIAFGSLLCRSVLLYLNPDVQAFWTFGYPWKKEMKLYDFMYATPFGRLPLYISGVALGEYMRRNQNFSSQISPIFGKIGCIAAFLCYCIVYLSYVLSASPNYEYSSLDGAIVTFIHTFCLVVFIIWTVWYCEMFKKSSRLYRFLAFNVFVVLNRMSTYFSVLHIVVVFKAATTKFITQINLSELYGTDYLLLTILICTYIVLFIDLPLKNLCRFVFHKKGTSKIDFVNQIDKDTTAVNNKHD